VKSLGGGEPQRLIQASDMVEVNSQVRASYIASFSIHDAIVGIDIVLENVAAGTVAAGAPKQMTALDYKAVSDPRQILQGVEIEGVMMQRRVAAEHCQRVVVAVIGAEPVELVASRPIREP
jgi:hypothetical protein